MVSELPAPSNPHQQHTTDAQTEGKSLRAKDHPPLIKKAPRKLIVNGTVSVWRRALPSVSSAYYSLHEVTGLMRKLGFY